jgi:transcriptional regulator with XRE-family HTH domain
MCAMDIRAVLAANIRRLRKERGWSQEKLAFRCGLHRTYIGSVERGERNISLDNIARLAQALSVEPWELIARGHGPEETAR